MEKEPTIVEPGKKYGDLGTASDSCKGQSGYWVCVNHPDDRDMATYRNQLQKDIHIQTGEHQLGWMCPEHGLEVP